MRYRVLSALACGLVAAAAAAAPYVPASDSEVVEKLPLSAADPSLRLVESLRKKLAANPSDDGLRVEVARRYFDLAMAQGDPRYVGYASAAIGPLGARGDQVPGYWLAHGLLLQYGHDFDGALSALEKAARQDTHSPEPLAWQAAIHMVQARYPQAQQACERLLPVAEPLFGAACLSYVQASTGRLRPAYAALYQSVERSSGASPGLVLWALTRLAEMAWRLELPADAERHFRRGLALGITDQFLLGAYADFLLEQRRPGEVIKLLAGWERSDILLLRLALAGKVARDDRAREWGDLLRERFQAAARRGDRLHEQEAARFALDFEANSAAALSLAVRNYQVQREPRDAEILMRAALAAGDPRAAQPALDWLRTSGFEGRQLSKLAAELTRSGARP